MYDEDLTNLEDGIRRLKIEYDIFFNGARKRPPEDLRGRVDKLIKRLAGATDLSFNQRFRLNTLTARYYLYKDLWRRTQMEWESRGPSHAPEGARSPRKPTAPAHPGAKVSVAIGDASRDEGKVRELYEALVRMRVGNDKQSAPVSYAQFAKYISNQTHNLQSKFRCDSVVFTITKADKDIKFTARAEKRGERLS